MPQKRSFLWPLVTVVIGVMIFLVALPQQWKGWAPGFLQSPSLHLGLDLVGGTQLDFRISEDEINAQRVQLQQDIKAAASTTDQNKLQAQLNSLDQQQQNLVEAIRTVLERRINALGVSEATITPSYIGNEKHLLVECPGIVDTQQCIAVVGKTIQLEFKEEETTPSAATSVAVGIKADAVLAAITQSGATLQKEGQDIGSQEGMSYTDQRFLFKDQLPAGTEDLWGKASGDTVYKRTGSVSQPTTDQTGKTTTQKVPGIFLVQILSPLTQTGRTINDVTQAFTYLAKTETNASFLPHTDAPLGSSVDPSVTHELSAMKNGELKAVAHGSGASILFLLTLQPGKEQVDVSHILVSYKGAQQAEATVTRTKAEALTRAQALKAKIDAGAKFEDVARSDSDGPSKAQGGVLGVIDQGTMPPAFDAVAFSQLPLKVSDPIETPYGYHLIRVNSAPVHGPSTASYDELFLTGPDALSRANTLITRMQNGQVTQQEAAQNMRLLFFSLLPSPWKNTTLDGKHFRSAAVTVDPTTNVPVVQIMFDDEGGRLFQDLTKNNINKRIAIFVGGNLVSAPTVQQEISGGVAIITGSRNFEEAQKLAQDLNTGAIPAPIHLVGQYTVEATLGAAALQTSLQAALIGTIILMLYMLLIYRMLGLMADIALGIYAVILFAVLKLPLLFFTSDYIVLTLAGMAGIILSIGMAVDANVLVFERMKEELRKGKLVKTAVEASFKHAWPAIRDSNVSTIITCGILFLIGSSIVRGFAITVGMGVFLSLFTAITITRWLLRHLAASPVARHIHLFVGGVDRKDEVAVSEIPD